MTVTPTASLEGFSCSASVPVACLWCASVTVVCGALLFPAFTDGIKRRRGASRKLQLSGAKMCLAVNWPFGSGNGETGIPFSCLYSLPDPKPNFQFISQIFIDAPSITPSLPQSSESDKKKDLSGDSKLCLKNKEFIHQE